MGVEMEELGKLSNGEVVQMLRDYVWRAVKESWAVQAEQHSKLKVVKELRKIQEHVLMLKVRGFEGC